MDNKIPSAIKDFVKQVKPEEAEGFNHLAFSDWIDKKEHLATDWTIVARTDRRKDDEDFFTISCFATPPTDETKKFCLVATHGKFITNLVFHT